MQHVTAASMEMAVDLPLLKRLGDRIGLDLDAALDDGPKRRE